MHHAPTESSEPVRARLLKDVFGEQMGRRMDAACLDELAGFNGRLFSAGLAFSRDA